MTVLECSSASHAKEKLIEKLQKEIANRLAIEIMESLLFHEEEWEKFIAPWGKRIKD